MPRKHRITQERAILAHRAHLPLLFGMGRAFEQLLPPGLRYILITLDAATGAEAGYISNATGQHIAGTRRSV